MCGCRRGSGCQVPGCCHRPCHPSEARPCSVPCSSHALLGARSLGSHQSGQLVVMAAAGMSCPSSACIISMQGGCLRPSPSGYQSLAKPSLYCHPGHALRPLILQVQAVADSQECITPSQGDGIIVDLDYQSKSSQPLTAPALLQPSRPSPLPLVPYNSSPAQARSRSCSPPEHERPRGPKRKPLCRTLSECSEDDPDFTLDDVPACKAKRSSTLSPGAGLRPRKSARLSAHSTSPGTLPDLPATTVGGLGPEAAHGSCSGAAGPARRRSGEGRLACLRLWSMAWHADRGAFGCM